MRGTAATIRRRLPLSIFWAACIAASLGTAVAADCQRGNFADWLEGFKQETGTLGISQKTITSALNGVTYDPATIARDHAQSVFQQSFNNFPGGWCRPTACVKEPTCSNGTGQYSVGWRTVMVCRRKCWSRSGDWKATTVSIRENIRRFGRSRLWPMIVDAPKNFGPNCLMRFE
jgi:hypothetical protein